MVNPDTVVDLTRKVRETEWSFLVVKPLYSLHHPLRMQIATFPEGSHACLYAGLHASLSVPHWRPTAQIPTPNSPAWDLGCLHNETQRSIFGHTYAFVKQTRLKQGLGRSFEMTLLGFQFGIFLLLGNTSCGNHCFVLNGWKRLVYLCDDAGTCVKITSDDISSIDNAKSFISYVLGLERGFTKIFLLLKK